MQIIKKTNTEILELENSTNEIQNATESINCTTEQGEKGKLWVRRQEPWHYPVRGERKKKKKKNGVKRVCTIYGIPQKETIDKLLKFQKEKKGAENTFKYIITENFLNLGRDLNILVYEAHSPQLKKIVSQMRYNDMSNIKAKDRILKAEREKIITPREPQ